MYQMMIILFIICTFHSLLRIITKKYNKKLNKMIRDEIPKKEMFDLYKIANIMKIICITSITVYTVSDRIIYAKTYNDFEYDIKQESFYDIDTPTFFSEISVLLNNPSQITMIEEYPLTFSLDENNSIIDLDMKFIARKYFRNVVYSAISLNSNKLFFDGGYISSQSYKEFHKSDFNLYKNKLCNETFDLINEYICSKGYIEYTEFKFIVKENGVKYILTDSVELYTIKSNQLNAIEVTDITNENICINIYFVYISKMSKGLINQSFITVVL